MYKFIADRLQTAFSGSTTRAATPFRIAFFGGSFDPPHNGHLQIASAVADRFALNEIWFEPAGLQPLKDPSSLSPYADRLAMTHLACEADPRFAAHQHDAPRRDGLPNYTVDSLIALNNSLALTQDDALYCIVGIDAFRSLDRWHRPVRLLGQAHWIICSRPGSTLSLQEIERVLPPCTVAPVSDPASNFALAAYDCTGERFSTRLYFFDSVHVDISSTQIREGIRAGGDARAHAESMMPPAVADYIRTHNLYQ